jgi:hypothetical protein
LLLLPDDHLPYEIVISPPFGEDISWVVASEKLLPLPAKLEGDWVDNSVFKGRVRELGKKTNLGYAEAQVLIKTVK